MKTLNGSRTVLFMATLLLCTLTVGCKSTKTLIINDSNYDLPNQNDLVLCSKKIVKAASTYPKMLYSEMNNCINSNHFDEATFLYALAGSYTWYDAVRVDTQYARSMHSRLLKESLSQLSQKQREVFLEQLQINFGDVDKKKSLCDKVKRVGAPAYQANYMFIDNSGVADYVISDDVNWDATVNSYMLCS